MVKKIKKTRWRNLEVPVGVASSTSSTNTSSVAVMPEAGGGIDTSSSATSSINDDKSSSSSTLSTRHRYRRTNETGGAAKPAVATTATTTTTKSNGCSRKSLVVDHKWAVPASGKKIYIPSSQMKKFGNSNNNGNGNATTTGCEDNSQKIKSSSGVADEDDEYTKITTPRQDVLFKKGYLTRRKNHDTTSAQENIDTEDRHYLNGDENLYMYSPAASYVDPSGMLLLEGTTSYEVFDPYTGSVAVVLETSPAMLATMPCKPVPLQSVQWFDPIPNNSNHNNNININNNHNVNNGASMPTEWCSSYPVDATPKQCLSSSIASATADSAQPNIKASTDAKEDSNEIPDVVNDLPQPQTQQDIANNSPNLSPPPIYQQHHQQYVYPGFVFGAPIYNVDGMNVQYCMPPVQNAAMLSDEDYNSKRKKKKRRRRKGDEMDENVETGIEERNNNLNLSPNAAEFVLNSKRSIDNLPPLAPPMYSVVNPMPVFDPKFLLSYPPAAAYPSFFNAATEIPYYASSSSVLSPLNNGVTPIPPQPVHHNYYQQQQQHPQQEIIEDTTTIMEQSSVEEKQDDFHDVSSSSSSSSQCGIIRDDGQNGSVTTTQNINENGNATPDDANNGVSGGESIKKVNLNVNCKPFMKSNKKNNNFENNAEKNELCEVGSNSSNSDSGISSPNSDTYVKEEDLCHSSSSSDDHFSPDLNRNVGSGGAAGGNTNSNRISSSSSISSTISNSSSVGVLLNEKGGSVAVAGSSSKSNKKVQPRKSANTKGKNKKNHLSDTFVITSIVDEFKKPNHAYNNNNNNNHKNNNNNNDCNAANKSKKVVQFNPKISAAISNICNDKAKQQPPSRKTRKISENETKSGDKTSDNTKSVSIAVNKNEVIKSSSSPVERKKRDVVDKKKKEDDSNNNFRRHLESKKLGGQLKQQQQVDEDIIITKKSTEDRIYDESSPSLTSSSEDEALSTIETRIISSRIAATSEPSKNISITATSVEAKRDTMDEEIGCCNNNILPSNKELEKDEMKVTIECIIQSPPQDESFSYNEETSSSKVLNLAADRPIAPPRRRRSSQKLVAAQAATDIIETIIAEAEKRIILQSTIISLDAAAANSVKSSSNNNNLEESTQLPTITEAVTKWLNEKGGLPVSDEIVSSDSELLSSDLCVNNNDRIDDDLSDDESEEDKPTAQGQSVLCNGDAKRNNTTLDNNRGICTIS